MVVKGLIWAPIFHLFYTIFKSFFIHKGEKELAIKIYFSVFSAPFHIDN